ncbi:MAG TPA: cytochrome c [Vicinamibacterales bacterium]|nr:cytochrome c [Vicinamibacterales bacterium]
MTNLRIVTGLIGVVSVLALSIASAGAQAPSGTQRPRSQPPTSPVTGNASTGKKLYEAYSCYACHGYNGETGRAFVGNWSGNLATETAFLSFLRGRANVAPAQPSTNMPNFSAETLSDAQAKDIYAYIRTFRSHAPDAEDIPVFNQILGAARQPARP